MAGLKGREEENWQETNDGIVVDGGNVEAGTGSFFGGILEFPPNIYIPEEHGMHEQKNSSEILVHLAFQCLLIMTGRFACLGEVGRLE